VDYSPATSQWEAKKFDNDDRTDGLVLMRSPSTLRPCALRARPRTPCGARYAPGPM